MLLSFLLGAPTLEAEPLTYKGIVVDSETKEPIPFAHVVIDDIVTLTNLDGQFVISTESTSKMLQVSVMGYEVTSQDLTDQKDYYSISLQPSVVDLEEVTILSGKLLMDKVFNRFHLNYDMNRQHMVAYYKEDLHGSDSLYYLAEGIVDIYVPPNIEMNNVLVSPIRTRKKVFKPLADNLVLLKGNASDMSQSSIWREDSFLSLKNRGNYEYVYSGTSKIGDREVFIIEFEPRNSKGNTSGKIFVEDKSFAVLKLEYLPDVEASNFWDRVAWTEEYYEKDGLYQLFRVSFNGSWYGITKEYIYDALLVVNEVDSMTEFPSVDTYMDENDLFFHEAEDNFSEEFWAGYNYIKLDVESSEMMAKQGVSIY